eukprot:CAMPEP_0180202880 /NCGR_PEP_ID=MMETSP0987-20121128/7549_1 /TAXON_ID=697907 /ORGANISM="non described non described, Strain CCMP2293" /LENGTH=342 /DNA_ID=CAMNT_0022158203 /DNA_START=246 /DNA_END=1274 /DNA_ORIENTATION=-
MVRGAPAFSAAPCFASKMAIPAMPRACPPHVPRRGMADGKPDIASDMVHFKKSASVHPLGVKKSFADQTRKLDPEVWDNPMAHAVWSEAEVHGVKATHVPVADIKDRLTLALVRFCRLSFDTCSAYNWGPITYDKVLNRAIFLETVAGVPGMAGGMLRHMRSLRRMERDHGWIHTLLEEAENERMHLLTFITLKKPGPIFRACVIGAQGLVMPVFLLTYMVSPRSCHRFVGYLEEEAVRTYTSIITAIDDDRLGKWKTEPAPAIAINYWHMHPNATMRDLFLQVRMDEASHRDVNHTFSSLRLDQTNPMIHAHAQTLMKPTEERSAEDLAAIRGTEASATKA